MRSDDYIQKLEEVWAIQVEEDWWEYNERGESVPSKKMYRSSNILRNVNEGKRELITDTEQVARPGDWLVFNGLTLRVMSHGDFRNTFRRKSAAPGKSSAIGLDEDYVLAKLEEASESQGEDWHKWAWLLEHRWPEKYAGKNLKGEAMRRACNVMLDAAHKTLGDEQFKALCEAIRAEEHKVDGAFERFFEKGKGESRG